MEILGNNTPQVELYKIHALIIAKISNNKAELVKANGYGDIAANDKAENNLYIFLYICPIYTPIICGIRWKSIGIL